MKIKLQHIIFGLCLCLFTIGTMILYSKSKLERKELTCERIEIKLVDDMQYVQEEDVRRYLRKELGELNGQRLDSVQLYRIEQIIESKSAVKKCEAWTSRDGCLHIELSQREPVIRFELGEKCFYADKEGFLFPLGQGKQVDVPVIKGAMPLNINENWRGEAQDEKSRTWVLGILSLREKINGNHKLKKELESLSVRKNGDICARLKECPTVFIFGQPDELDKKMEGLQKYFEKIVPVKGDKYYKSVNLKYNKQIVCRTDM